MSTVLIVVIVIVVLAWAAAALAIGRRAKARRRLERERLAEQADSHRDEDARMQARCGQDVDRGRNCLSGVSGP